jgi:hypothetical protein
MTRAIENRKFGISVAFFVILLIALPTFFMPFGRDQSTLAYVARSLLDGGLPYVSYWDHKGPLLAYIYCLGSWGDIGEYKMHIVDFIGALSTAYFLSVAVRKLFPDLSSLLIAVIYGVLYFTLGFWHLIQGEGFMNIALAAGLLLIARPTRKNVFIVGLLFGAASTIKPISIFHLLALSVIFFKFRRDETKDGLRLTLLSIAGFSVIPILFTLLYLVTGHFTQLYENLFLFNLLQDKQSVIHAAVWVILTYSDAVPVAIIAVVIGYFYLRHKSNAYAQFSLLCLTVASIVGLFIQQRLWLYHWVILLPFASVYIGAGATALYRTLIEPNNKLLVRFLSAAVLLIGIIAFGVRWLNVNHIDSLFKSQHKLEYYDTFHINEIGYNVSRSFNIAQYIRERTGPEDKILLWGFDGNSYHFADRPHASRFIFDLPLTFETTGPRASKLRQKWRNEFIDEIKRDPPELIGLVEHDSNAMEKMSSFDQAFSFIGFHILLRSDYVQSDRVGNIIFYQRKKQEVTSFPEATTAPPGNDR